MIEQHQGYGNEPLEPPVENGKVLQSDELHEYSSQDEHFAAVDRLSDLGVANYADAAQRVGYDPAKYDTDGNEAAVFAVGDTHRDPKPGAFVTLRDRKVAVQNLMDGISAQNQYSGATHSGALEKYKNTAEVSAGMRQKAERYRQDRPRAVEMLAKTAALREVGFDEAQVAASQAGINRNLSILSEAGPKVARLRTKQKKVTEKTSKIVNGY